MHKALAIALAAPLMLIGAAYPELDKFEEAGDEASAPVTYRPCRPGPGDDRCIQLYERGVRASYAAWLRDHDVATDRTQLAMGGPEDVRSPPARTERGAHPAPRRHRMHDRRCMDDDGHSPAVAGEAPAHPDAHDDHGETRGM